MNNHPKVDPFMSSACELMISAIDSSLKASFGLYHFLPPGKTSGRSRGVLHASRDREILAFSSLLRTCKIIFESVDLLNLTVFCNNCVIVELCYHWIGNIGVS